MNKYVRSLRILEIYDLANRLLGIHAKNYLCIKIKLQKYFNIFMMIKII